MDFMSLVDLIDQELRRLEEARSILSKAAASGSQPAPAERFTRPKPRRLSAEGRARIAEGQRKRWAEHRKKKRAMKRSTE